MNYELLKRLCEAPGVPGAEEPVREIVAEEAASLVDELEIDPLGNLILHRKGPGPKVLLDAHLDEVGFMVAGIEGAFLRVIPLGGLEPKLVYGQRLLVWGRKRITAVVASRPPHLGREEKPPAIEEMLLDTGLGEEETQALVSVGDPVTFPPYFEETSSSVWGKALDDRVGLFVMLEALRRASPRVDLYLSASVQEETGLRGAYALAQRIGPEVVLALEGTLASDLPGTPAHLRLAACGKGPELRLSDARFLADRSLTLGLSALAREKGIPHQLVVKNRGGTNATAFQVAGGPVRAAALAVPVRYLHGPVGLAFKSDLEALVELVTAFLNEPEDVLNYRWSYPT